MLKQSTMFALSFITLTAPVAMAAPVAEWNFDAVTGGTTIEDQVGSIDGTITGSVTLVTSNAGVSATGFGNAGQFGSAAGDNLALGTAPAAISAFGATGFSVTGWINPNQQDSGTGTNLFRMILENGQHNTGGFNLYVYRSGAGSRGRLGFDIKGTSSGNITALSDARVDLDSDSIQWHWFAAVSDGSTISLYVDGVKQAATASFITGTTATPPGTYPTKIGTGFDGLIDQLVVHNTALTGTLSGNTLTGGDLYDLWQQSIPEPASLALLGLGGLMVLRRRG